MPRYIGCALDRPWLFLVIVVIINMCATVYALWPQADFEPLGNYTNPQKVLTPIVEEGGTVLIEGQKCNLSASSVMVRGSIFFRTVDEPVLFAHSLSGSSIRSPGCINRVWENRLPADVVAGRRWKMGGFETAIEGNKTQTIAFESESFLVVK